jgi:nicotinamide-nucleotide amidase
MAGGGRARIGVDLAVAVTGIAGPSGGTEEKPVGTVWFAIAAADGIESKRVIFLGSRKEIRERAAQTALFLLNRRLLTD